MIENGRHRLWRKAILVGAGGFGALWDRALDRHGIVPVAVVDPDYRSASTAAQRYGIARSRIFDGRTSDWASEQADLVIDSAPPMGRLERVLTAVEHGLDVIAAKPALESSTQAEAALRAIGQRRTALFVAMQKRQLPAFQRLKRLCDAGALGKIEYVGIDLQVDGTVWQPGMAWRRGLRYPSLHEGGIHHLDLVQWLLRPRFRSVTAVGWRPSWSAFEHASDFAAVLEGDVTVHYLARWAMRGGQVSHYFSGLRLEGTDGAAAVRDGKLFVDGAHIPTPGDGEELMDLAALNERLIGHLVDQPPNALGDYELPFHLEVLRLADAIDQALLTKSRVELS